MNATPIRSHPAVPAGPAKLLALLLGLVALAPTLRAAEQLEASTSATNVVTAPSVDWNTNPAHWERMLEQRQGNSAIQIGKTDFVLSGPLVDGVRRQKGGGDRSLGRRLLSLPIVRLFVPQPMPSPPGGGRYFKWGERDAMWASIGQPASPLGNTDNPIHRDFAGSLISVGLK